jgi:hypothetical protein
LAAEILVLVSLGRPGRLLPPYGRRGKMIPKITSIFAFLIFITPVSIMAYWAGRMAYDGIDGYGWFLLLIAFLFFGLKVHID